MKHSEQPTPILNPYWFIVIGCLLLMFTIALPMTDADAPWLDEAFTFNYSGLERAPEASIIDSITFPARFDTWPPLYYILQNIWSDFTGDALYAINLLQVIFGLLSVALSYRLATLLFGSRRAGAIASLLLGFSSFAFYYLHEIRGYALFLLVWVFLILAYWQLVITPDSKTKTYRRVLTAAVVIALYTHYISMVMLAALIAYHVLFEYREATRHENMNQTRWLNTLKAMINGFLFYAPWLAVFYLILISFEWSSNFTPFTEIMATLIRASSNNLWLIAVPLVFLSLAKLKENGTRFLWFWTSLLLVGFFLMNWLFDYLFHPRHIFPIVLLFILLITQGILVLDRFSQWIGAVFVALWVATGIWFVVTDTDLGYQPYLVPLATMNQLDIVHEQCFDEGDTVILSLADNTNDPRQEEISMGALNVYYYARRNYQISPLIDLVNTDSVFTDTPNRPPFDDSETFDIITRVSEAQTPIYLFTAINLDNQSEIERFDSVIQEQGYEKCPMLWEHDALLGWVYTMQDDCQQLLTCAP